MMKNVFFLIIIISLSSVNLSFAGFLDDVFKAIGDGIQKGVKTVDWGTWTGGRC